MAVIGRSVAEFLGLGEVESRLSLRPPLPHQSNRLYDLYAGGRRFIVKEYLKEAEFDTSPLREIQSLHLLGETGIAPVPAGHIPPADGRRPLVIYEFMAGQMWDRQKPGPADLEKLAEAWLRMHSLTRPGLWTSRGHGTYQGLAERFKRRVQVYLRWSRSAFPAGRAIMDFWQALYPRLQPHYDRIAKMDKKLLFCRADPRFANVIDRPDGSLGMVDWEDAGLRDPAMDLADLVTHPNQEDLLSSAEWKPFIEPYLAALKPQDPLIETRFQAYLFLFPVFYLAVLLEVGAQRGMEGRLEGWAVNEMDPNTRLRRMLARALAWPQGDLEGQLTELGKINFFPIYNSGT